MKIDNLNDWMCESPQMIDSTDFNLTDEKHNIDFAKSSLAKSKEIIEETDDFILFRTGDKINGYIALIDKPSENIPDPSIDYLVKYHSRKFKSFGEAVTQVGIWRRTIGTGVPNITKRVFWDYLLAKWPSIMSDTKQTKNGKDFWMTRLQEAVGYGFKVGLADISLKKIYWYTGDSKSFRIWIKNQSAWVTEDKHQHKRFIISKK